MKKSLITISIIALCSLLSACSHKAPWDDPKGEYIINPDLPMYKQYQWATWRDSAGGRLSHDPKWFILPASHYIPKEVPFDWDKVKNLSPLEKRNLYFNHLCKTESVGYRTPDYPQDIVKNKLTATSTWLYIRSFENPIKDMKNVVNHNPDNLRKILNIAKQNPFINPNYGYHEWNEKWSLVFDLADANEEYYSKNYGQPLADTFREYMDTEGTIWRLPFDIKTNRFGHVIKDTQSKARYYILYRDIERPEMHKLGIVGRELISYDKQEKKLLEYAKFFQIPLYMQSMQDSSNQLPIDWFRQDNCAVDHIKTVEDLSK